MVIIHIGLAEYLTANTRQTIILLFQLVYWAAAAVYHIIQWCLASLAITLDTDKETFWFIGASGVDNKHSPRWSGDFGPRDFCDG